MPSPEKIICVGQNYRDHVLEMGNEIPDYPTVFAKYAPALIGAHDDIVLPVVSDKVDCEAELTVVIGRPVRHATAEQAGAAIAGYTVLNDVSVRDWQLRTKQFLQGKTFEQLDAGRTVAGHPGRAARRRLGDQQHVLDGETMQHSNTDQLLFTADRPDLLPVADRHPEPRRPDRHRHPGRGRPRPQAARAT